MRSPLDPFSKVLDEQSHWDPEWYSWLTEITTAVTQLQATVAANAAVIASHTQSINTLNNNFPIAPWLLFTPIVVGDTGTVTVTSSGRYRKYGKLVVAYFNFTITSVSGANYVQVQAPVIPVVAGAAFFRENAVIGYSGHGFQNGNSFFLVRFDNSPTAGVNHQDVGMMIYETSF